MMQVNRESLREAVEKYITRFYSIVQPVVTVDAWGGCDCQPAALVASDEMPWITDPEQYSLCEYIDTEGLPLEPDAEFDARIHMIADEIDRRAEELPWTMRDYIERRAGIDDTHIDARANGEDCRVTWDRSGGTVTITPESGDAWECGFDSLAIDQGIFPR